MHETTFLDTIFHSRRRVKPVSCHSRHYKHLLTHLLIYFSRLYTLIVNNMDPDQTVSLGAVLIRFRVFAFRVKYS